MLTRTLGRMKEMLRPPAPASAESLSHAEGLAVTAAMVMVVLASVAVRLLLIAVFPTKPISDFEGIVGLANEIANGATFSPNHLGWTSFGAGTSTVLAAIQALFGAEPERSARVATAVMMGGLPLIPLLVLRRVVAPCTRLLIAGAIAFLPALVIFSGVPAQDNWAMLPALGLACLALRNHRLTRRGYPVTSAILWSLGGFFRQEMLLVALPLALLASWPLSDWKRPRRHAAMFGVVSVLLLSAVGLQRYHAIGHFAVGTSHGGQSILGSYVPGVGFGWAHSRAYLATLPPDEKGRDWRSRSREEGYRLVAHEVAERPVFHLFRRVGAMVYTATGADRSLPGWSLGSTTQRPELQPAAARLVDFSQPLVILGLILLHALFVASLPIVWFRRDPVMIAIALAVIMKLGIHFIVAAQARFVLTLVPLEAVVAIATFTGLTKRTEWKVYAATFLVSFVALLVAWRMLPAWASWVAAREWPNGSPVYRFELSAADVKAKCEMDRGVMALDDDSISVRSIAAEPQPNTRLVEVRCQLVPSASKATVHLEVEDRYPPGGRPGNIVQEVDVNGAPALRHDVGAKEWAGWSQVPLPSSGGGPASFSVRVEAVNPSAGASWGGTPASTEIRLVAKAPASH